MSWERVGVLIVMGLVAACATSPGAEEPNEPVDGAVVYASTCNRCHNFRSPVEFTDAEWSVIATHMRIVGGLPADEARAVHAYLRENNNPPLLIVGGEAAAVGELDGGDPVGVGRALIARRGCQGCHTVEGVGGSMGPPLDGLMLRRAEPYVVSQLRNPQANTPESRMPNLGLSEREIAALVEYLKTLSP